jgi:hypothetical protein
MGPQGLTGSNELDFAIQYLDGAINILLEIAKEQDIPITRYNRFYPKCNYVSEDTSSWRIAQEGDLENPKLNKILKNGRLILKSA